MLHSTPGWLQAMQLQKMRVQKHRWWRPLLWAGLVVLALLMAWQVATLRALQAAESVALSDAWHFVDEGKPGAPAVRGELATTSVGAPTQVAARFALSSTMQALALQWDDVELAGLPLAQVEELSYCTRLVEGLRPYAVTLQLNVDADVTDGDNSWQGRLVYTPSYNGAVIQGEWQCWNTLVGKWWATSGPVAAQASADNPLPLGTLLAHFPNLGINARYNVVALKAGDGWNAFRGEASPVVIAVEGARMDVAFGTPPQESAEENEILLPVVFNESQITADVSQPDTQDGKQRDKEEKKADKEAEKQAKQHEKWNSVDWGTLDWRDVDWQNFDWEKVDWEHLDWEHLDWEHLDWGAFGWGGNEHAEAVAAFVEDVKQCHDRGWEQLGFNKAGDCVAYYVQVHTPTDLKWGRTWSYGDNDHNNGGDDNGRRTRWNRRDDD